MKEIVILLVVLCVSAIGLSGAVAAWYFLYYRPKTMTPAPALAAVLAPTYQTIVAPTYPPPVPKTNGGPLTPPPIPKTVIKGTPSGAAWESFKGLLGFGKYSLGAEGDWKSVVGKDGKTYYMRINSDPQKILAFLEPCVAQMPALASQLSKNLGANDLRVTRFEQWLSTMRLWNTALVVIYEHPFHPDCGCGALQSGEWLVMGNGWFNQECIDPMGNYKSCMGSVIHELAHLLCAWAPPGHECEGHASGWCRINAELLKAANEIGMFVPYNSRGGHQSFNLNYYDNITGMLNTAPYADKQGVCGT